MSSETPHPVELCHLLQDRVHNDDGHDDDVHIVAVAAVNVPADIDHVQPDVGHVSGVSVGVRVTGGFWTTSAAISATWIDDHRDEHDAKMRESGAGALLSSLYYSPVQRCGHGEVLLEVHGPYRLLRSESAKSSGQQSGNARVRTRRLPGWSSSGNRTSRPEVHVPVHIPVLSTKSNGPDLGL